MYAESMSGGPINKQLQIMLQAFLPAGIIDKIPLLIVTLTVFYFFIYFSEFQIVKSETYQITYYLLFPIILLVMLTKLEPYRLVYLIPFLFIIFILNEEKLIINLLLECVACVALMIIEYIKHFDIFFANGNVFQYVNNLIPVKKFFLISEDITKYDSLLGILAGCYFSAFLLILIINHPKYNKNIDCTRMEINN